MRLKLTLQHRANVLIPLNYQYEVSAWIYKVISESDHEFSAWLHHKGYEHGATTRYKFFNFSQLESTPYYIDKARGGMLLQGTQSSISISFLVDEAISHFVAGIFKQQHFGLGNAQFRAVDFQVGNVEVQPTPSDMTTLECRANSPIVLSRRTERDRYDQYLSPEDPEYAELLENNLRNRLVTALTHNVINIDASAPNTPFAFELLTAPKKKKITIKANTPSASDIIGYEYDFRITAAPPLLRIGLLAGFGEKGSTGFGWCRWRGV